jgi:hypothetical protein
MARGNKDDAMTLTNPRLPRIVCRVSRSIQFSAPAPGRPKVFWMEGINPDIVREHWPSQGELPYEESELPSYISSIIPGGPRRWKRYSFGVPRKMILYERAHSGLRLVLLLGPAYDRDGETWQPIERNSVERDPCIDPRQSRPIEERLWDELCLVQRRGRPRGTGHAKAPRQRFAFSSDTISRLRRQGLDDKDLRILFGWWDQKSFKQIGRELGISGQAAWKRWNLRIEPSIRRVNPNFSRASFRMSSLDSK